MCTCCKIASKASSICRTPRNVLALEEKSRVLFCILFVGGTGVGVCFWLPPGWLHSFCSDVQRWLSWAAPWGLASSADIHQQFPSPTVVTLFTDTVIAKTFCVLKQSLFSLACFYNFAFFFMLITSAMLWGKGMYVYPCIFRYKHTN